MNMRERMLAVVEGRPHDRVPFVQYSGLAGPDKEIWGLIGRENMGLLAWTSVHRFESPNCRFVYEDIVRDGRPGTRTILRTPEGDLSEERLTEPTFGTSAAHTHFVKEPEDYRVLMAYLRDIQVHKDLDLLIHTIKAMGEDGLPHTSLVRSPYQQLWIQWVSLQDLPIHLALFPEIMEEVVALLFEVQGKVIDTACLAIQEGTPVPYLVFPDNITAPAIGEEYFRKYCVASYEMLANRLEEIGKRAPIFVHMDGDLKPLAAAIAESPVLGLDSFSPRPDNDMHVSEAVTLWPETRLCLNFPSSVHLSEPDAIFAQAMQILEEGGHTGRLQIQISENVPPGVWKKSFPEIVKAIQAFGRPTGD